MPNFDDIMAMAQQAQAELQKAQDNLETIEVEGQAAAGLVRVRATAKGRLLAVSIDDAAMDDKALLEDMIVAAFNDARAKADAKANEAMGEMTAGLALPPGFKMPF